MVAAPSPTVVESHASSYGAVSSSTVLPSGSAKDTRSTVPSASAASADTMTSPLTVAPSAGAVIETVGGVLPPPSVDQVADQPGATTEPSLVNLIARRVEVASGGAVVPLVFERTAPLASLMSTKSYPASVLKASRCRVAG